MLRAGAFLVNSGIEAFLYCANPRILSAVRPIRPGFAGRRLCYAGRMSSQADPPRPSGAEPSLLLPRELAILALLTLCWGLNWPVMKLGVQHYPPLTFRALSMLLGLMALWLIARLLRTPLTLPRVYWRSVLLLGLPNMVVWHVCIIIGVAHLSSGRAAILGYTMPLWAALCAWLLYRERLTARAWAGLACALGGCCLRWPPRLAGAWGRYCYAAAICPCQP